MKWNCFTDRESQSVQAEWIFLLQETEFNNHPPVYLGKEERGAKQAVRQGTNRPGTNKRVHSLATEPIYWVFESIGERERAVQARKKGAGEFASSGLRLSLTVHSQESLYRAVKASSGKSYFDLLQWNKARREYGGKAVRPILVYRSRRNRDNQGSWIGKVRSHKTEFSLLPEIRKK